MKMLSKNYSMVMIHIAHLNFVKCVCIFRRKLGLNIQNVNACYIQVVEL